MTATDKLAIDGGEPVRREPMPARRLIGEEERAEVMKLFDEAIASGDAFRYGGPTEQRYEQAFVDLMGGGFADGVNSGSNAVYCALGALDVDALSEVVVPPITDGGGVMPVALLGLVPVVADCAPDTYNTGAEQIEAVVTERTRAIVVAHIGGDPVDMGPVMTLARERGLPVVEDCAQAHGSRLGGRPVGTFGDIAAFSTMSGKHHCTGGQGGVVYSQNEALHWEGRRFADRGKAFGIEGLPVTANQRAGLNCNLGDLPAAIGLAQLRKLPGIVARRRKNGETIKTRLADECRAVRVGRQTPDSESAYWFVRIKLDLDAVRVSKAEFCEAMAAEGVRCAVDYNNIPCDKPWFRDRRVFGKSGFPWTNSDYHGPKEPDFCVDNARRVVAEHFNIPFHENYGEREIDDIVEALKKVERAYGK